MKEAAVAATSDGNVRQAKAAQLANRQDALLLGRQLRYEVIEPAPSVELLAPATGKSTLGGHPGQRGAATRAGDALMVPAVCRGRFAILPRYD